MVVFLNIRLKGLLVIVAVLVGLCFNVATCRDEFVVTVYVPEYRLGHVHDHTDFILPRVTDVLLFSVEPTPQGTLQATDRILWDGQLPERFQKQARTSRGPEQADTRFSVSIGGAGRSSNFAAVASSEQLTRKFARTVRDFVDTHDLDGVDIDWEAQFQPKQVEQFFRILSTELRNGPNPVRVTVALHHFMPLPAAAYDFVDAVHLMAYDLSSGPEGHSSLKHSKQTVQMIEETGCPRSKIVLGVPAYSRQINNPGKVKTYSELISADPSNAERDQSSEADGFNGLPTIRAKTRWAREQGLGGIMVWEVGQDTVDDKTSILAAIQAEALRDGSVAKSSQPQESQPKRKKKKKRHRSEL